MSLRTILLTVSDIVVGTSQEDRYSISLSEFSVYRSTFPTLALQLWKRRQLQKGLAPPATLQYFEIMSTENKRDENGDRLLCDAWRGARTPEFRKFKRDFKASADAMFLTERSSAKVFGVAKSNTHTRSRRSIPHTQITEVAHSLKTTHMGSTRLGPSYCNTVKFGV